jgi:hypothetical protein
LKPIAALADHPHFCQALQLVRSRLNRHPALLREIPHAELIHPDQGVEQPQPGWMGQALEENSDPLGFENSDKRTGGQRQFRAARLQVKPFRILELC